MNIRPAALAAMLLASLVFLVAGCGSSSDEKDNGQSAATPAATSTADNDADSDKDAGESEEEKEKEAEEAKANGGKDCDSAGDLDGDPKQAMPSDVPVLDGAHVYESQGPFGKTEQYFAAVDGDAEELPEKRDAVVTQLEGAGYKKLATDQEEGTEAEAHLSGPHTVDIQVINLCNGKLRIRYTVG
jgi:hypothetical protein